MSRVQTISHNLMIIVFFVTLTLFITPAFAQDQRVSSSNDNFSIMAPPVEWELVLDQDDILLFRNSTKETVMTFKKMPNKFSDLENFVVDYKSNVEANGEVVVITQESELIDGVEASKFKLELKEPNKLAPGTQGQVYLLLINQNAYFFEAFGLRVHSEYSDLFNKMAKSFELNKSSNEANSADTKRSAADL